jgi:hypothetical protein
MVETAGMVHDAPECTGIKKDGEDRQAEEEKHFDKLCRAPRCHAPTLYFVYYNFVSIHKSPKVSPAMAAGLTDKLWGWDAGAAPPVLRNRATHFTAELTATSNRAAA